MLAANHLKAIGLDRVAFLFSIMATIISQASLFFDKLSTEEATAFGELSALIKDNPIKEAEWIEYKSGFDKDVDEHWGKALSGFANSGGGIIIWGINTKTEDNHDVPDSLVLVGNAVALAGRLEALKATIVEPPVLNVQIRAVSQPDGKGFVVALISESYLRPHRVKTGKHSERYFVRIGFQTLPAPHSLLRILFYPESNPIYMLWHDVISGSPTQGFVVRFGLWNLGHTTIENSFVGFVSNKELILEADHSNFHAAVPADKEATIVCKHNIHPDSLFIVGQALMHADTELNIKVYARNTRCGQWTFAGTGETGKFKAKRVEHVSPLDLV